MSANPNYDMLNDIANKLNAVMKSAYCFSVNKSSKGYYILDPAVNQRIYASNTERLNYYRDFIAQMEMEQKNTDKLESKKRKLEKIAKKALSEIECRILFNRDELISEIEKKFRHELKEDEFLFYKNNYNQYY